MSMPPSKANHSRQLTREQCDAELQDVVCAITTGDYAAAERTAFALHEWAKLARLMLIVNRAATVVAAVRVRDGTDPLLSESVASLAEAIKEANFAPASDSP